MAPVNLEVPLTFDDTLGAAFIGYSVSCVLFGLLLAQSSRYYSMYPADKMAYKAIVLVIGIVETADQILISHALYHHTVSTYGSGESFLLGKAIWSMILQTALGGFVGLLVKICFGLRVWRFSNHNNLLTGFIMLLCLGQFGLEIAFTVRCFQLEYFAFLPSLKHLGTIALGFGVFTDVVIAVSLCYYLLKLKKGYAVNGKNRVVKMLMVYAVSTGAVTSTIAAMALLFYNLMPLTFIYIAFYFVLSKLYAISFLAALNTRRVVENRGTDRGTLHTGTQPPPGEGVLGSFGTAPWKSQSRVSVSLRISKDSSKLQKPDAYAMEMSPASESIPLRPLRPSGLSISPIQSFTEAPSPTLSRTESIPATRTPRTPISPKRI